MGIFNKLNKYFMLTASLFLIFIFSAFSIANFFKSFYANEMELYKDKLEYRAMLQSTIVKNHLKNNMMVLESAANIFTYNENMDTKDILDLAIKLKNLTQFDRVFIADKDGKAYFSSGDIHNVAHTKYFANSINGIHEITEITDSLFEKGTQIFLEAVPIIRHNKTIGIVCGVYKLSTFSFLLHESMQAKNGYILLTSSSQEFILKSSNIDKTISENNIWEFFSNATFNKNNIREKIENDILNLKNGFMEYTHNGSREFAYYSPLGINNWYIISVVSVDAMQNRLNFIQSLMTKFSTKMFIIFILGMISIIYFNKKAKDELIQSNKRLKLDEEIFRVAMDRTSNIAFEYNQNTKTLTFKNSVPKRHQLNQVIENVPESLVENNFVCEESVGEFLKIYERIFNKNVKNSSGVIRVQISNNSYLWERLTLTNIFDENKNIIRTVGVIENVTEEKENEVSLFLEKQYCEALQTDNIYTYEINLSKNTINLLNKSSKKKNYDKLFEYFIKHKIHSEDIQNVRESFSRKNMLLSYFNGVNEFKADYRIKDNKGKYIWTECCIRVIKKISTDEIKGILLIKDISNIKELKEMSEKDPLTSLYNRRAIKKHIDNFLENSKEDKSSSHAFIILDLDNFKTLNDTLGHVMGDIALQELSLKLIERFKDQSIIGRLGGDEFIVFLKNISSREELSKTLKKVLNDFTITYSHSDLSVAISVSIGVAVFPQDGTTFQELYKKSDIALYNIKNTSKNSFAFYE
ncbi:diguanylate cyclase (GGDEF)-like protein [Fusobacterium sp. PH5-7]|uniref:sensor domain-containing diguanylate cyclase n=1 Tax=Fusobacterium sp. PH5-7 TaxID=2940528 RepID=UPI002475E2EF|nr:diguanylate cyclase [Fusobacterium sp. PH5-7]MDH6459161.1 diguanylate cyclase (GGDEF)-like protein [Fusobacterium sp. PH5-7]